MDAAELTDVCRLCPVSSVSNTQLINVFDERFSGKYNIKEVILVTTGIEVLQNDLISVKICDRCLNITLKMFKFRQDAIQQDKSLRGKLSDKLKQFFADQEIRIPNTEVRIKRETPSTSSAKKIKKDLDVHNSVTQMFNVFPTLKLPSICMKQDMAPFVSLPMGDVEKYFKDRKLNMNQYISKSPAASMSNRIAKKRVRVSSQHKKTVTPLKISKKMFKPHEKSTETSGSYFCTPVNEVESRKRSLSTGSGLKAKISKESIPGCSNSISNVSVTPLKVTLEHTTPVDQSEDSRDSVTSNKSTATSSSSSNEAHQNAHSESFDLNPSVTRKCETQLVCHLCASVHNNASELKRHTLKHMVCQFCKRRFKSLENKNHHINNICVIKKMMNTSDPKVHLTKIDLDLETRRKYENAFTMFEPIQGSVKPEEVFVRAASPSKSGHQYNIIVLSDDDTDVNEDPLSGSAPTPEIIPSATISYFPEPVLYNSSIVRPDIKIKTNDIISPFFGNTNEKEVMKGLLRRPDDVKICVEKMIQTDMPSSKDINIKSDGTCEFKNLKEQIVPFKVPIHIVNGPFNVTYKFDSPPKSAKKSEAWDWDSVPFVRIGKKSTKIQPAVANSKPVASSLVPIQLPVVLINNNPQPDVSQSNNAQAVNSPTPMLQTYFDRAPNATVPRKSLPIPKTYLSKNSNSALKSILAANTPVSQNNGPKSSVNTSISNAVLNNTTNQRSPNTLLSDMLDGFPTASSSNMTEEIASNMRNLLNNTPHSNSPAKNSTPHRTVSTNQVFVNNTIIPNNSANRVQNDVMPMSSGRTSNSQFGVSANFAISANLFAPNTTAASSNNPAPIQNIHVSTPNQQNYSPSVTPNSNMFTSPGQSVSNTHRNLMPNAQMNVNPPRSLLPATSATQSTQRNVPSLVLQRNSLLLPNSQRNVNSSTMATQNTQRNVPALVPHRNAFLMPNPNTQRNNTYSSSEPARFRVKDIRELQ
ncbi:unnamed protein product [Ceutorhynchus assimilis]|uniref:ZAD domain-containing protein n=1 Tax=Ceutorhynchus assimilis TaxID=467358 RepID=A0A9N9QN29_9CUCU|nr:unnamed protein product [Ceutorhynchus assimilis]